MGLFHGCLFIFKYIIIYPYIPKPHLILILNLSPSLTTLTWLLCLKCDTLSCDVVRKQDPRVSDLIVTVPKPLCLCVCHSLHVTSNIQHRASHLLLFMVLSCECDSSCVTSHEFVTGVYQFVLYIYYTYIYVSCSLWPPHKPYSLVNCLNDICHVLWMEEKWLGEMAAVCGLPFILSPLPEDVHIDKL